MTNQEIKKFADKYKDLLDQVPEENVEEVMDLIMTAPNPGVRVMRLKNWLKNREKALSKKEETGGAMIVGGAPPRPSPRPKDRAEDVAGKVVRGYVQKGDDRREVTIGSTGTGSYILEVSRHKGARTCECCFKTGYDGQKFRKEEIIEKLRYFRSCGYEIHVDFK